MSCPICLNAETAPALSGTDTLFGTTGKRFTLDACAYCGCLFINPPPGNDEIASFYPSEYWWNSSPSTARPWLKTLERIYRRIALRDHIAFIRCAAGKRTSLDLLDVGCGSGTLIGL